MQITDEEIYIVMPDGVRLAARLWKPASAEQHPVPAILEYIPYRKRDDTRHRDEQIHPYLAANGYAAIRVDMRGSGDSEGLLLDEYLPIEQQDGVAVVGWLAEQPWCTGNVGMFGLSWGGITSLQIAALAPPALKAIIPVGASVDRYYDDACYFVGCFPGETVGWGSVMFGYNSRPPDPVIFGPKWRQAWLDRLNSTPMFLQTWLEHQRRDDYWLQGTICTDYSRIKVPVYAISGWNDCWPNTVLRLMENLDTPCKGLLGAWSHMYPDQAHPGPAANFGGEALRWFDRWLKEIDNGVELEAPLTCYIQDRAAIDPMDDHRPGRWVDVAAWPASDQSLAAFFPTSDGLRSSPSTSDGIAPVNSPLSVGKMSGEYMPLAQEHNDASLPGNQREEDAGSTTFDTEPLAEPLEFLGTPRITLNVASSAPCGLVAVRLCDVSPEGDSALITYGILNLAQREGREGPRPVEPGKRYQVSVRLNDVGYRIAKGHRLRLAVSNSMWPMAWPVPDRHELTLHLDQCRLDLPQQRVDLSDVERSTFAAAQRSEPCRIDAHTEGTAKRSLSQDLTTGLHHYRVLHDHGRSYLQSSDLVSEGEVEQHFSIRDDDPSSAKARYRFRFCLERGDWRVRTEGWLEMTCDKSNFYLDASLSAFENDEQIFERQWQVPIIRDGF